MFDQLWRIAVDFEPRQRVAENRTMDETALDARVRGEVAEPPLQRKDLTKAFDVPAGERKVAEPRT